MTESHGARMSLESPILFRNRTYTLCSLAGI
jgi:hypothetical protein